MQCTGWPCTRRVVGESGVLLVIPSEKTDRAGRIMCRDPQEAFQTSSGPSGCDHLVETHLLSRYSRVREPLWFHLSS
jgi:hypothetical protein